MAQTSFHSEAIFDLIIATFSSSTDKHKLADLEQLKARSQVGDEEWKAVLSYSAQVRPSAVRPLDDRTDMLQPRCFPTSPTTNLSERPSLFLGPSNPLSPR